ncbi:YfiR family protein [Massilia sp. H-1]|nr:YfiR family protein [Massilia sp. H-1]
MSSDRTLTEGPWQRWKRMPCWWHWPGWLAWLVLAVFGLARAEAPAAHAAPLERQVQAAYLVKFAGFTEWPEASFARPDSVLQIGVVEATARWPICSPAWPRPAASTAIRWPCAASRRATPWPSLHMLFIDASLDAAAAQALLAASAGLALLTVSDAEPAPDAGCMIHFVIDDERLRFDVLMRHVAPSGLRISAHAGRGPPRAGCLMIRMRSIRKKLAAVVLLATLAALLVSISALIVYDLRSYHRSLLSDMATQAELMGRMTSAALTFDDKKLAR